MLKLTNIRRKKTSTTSILNSAVVPPLCKRRNRPNERWCPRFRQHDGKMAGYHCMDDIDRGIKEGSSNEGDGRYEEGDIDEVNIGGRFGKEVEEYCEEGLEVECGADAYAGDV